MAAMVRDVLELGSSLGFLDEISEGFQQQPDAIDPSWRSLLTEHPPIAGNGHHPAGNGHPSNGRAAQAMAAELQTLPPVSTRPVTMPLSPVTGQAAPMVWPLVNAYRSRGHFNARLDPLGLLETARIVELDPATWGFTARDLGRLIEPTGVHGLPRATL